MSSQAPRLRSISAQVRRGRGECPTHQRLVDANYCAPTIAPLGTQRPVEDILSTYGNLIENNAGRIQILEEMARTIYRECIVHFNYPGHGGPSPVVSLIVPVPEGWEVKRFPDAVEVRPQVRVPRADLKPCVPMGSLDTDSMVIHPIEERSGNSGSKFQNGDTFMARITPSLENGKTVYVQFLPEDDAIAFGSTEFIDRAAVQNTLSRNGLSTLANQ